MSELKATPGPWRAGEPGPNGCPTVGTISGLMTAFVAHSVNHASQKCQAVGDAHLIAASPDLYDALKESLSQIEQLVSDGHIAKGTVAENRARAALAKARGEQ